MPIAHSVLMEAYANLVTYVTMKVYTTVCVGKAKWVFNLLFSNHMPLLTFD